MKEKAEIGTGARLERAIKNWPENWIVVRDKDTGELLEAADKDTGRWWRKIKYTDENGEQKEGWVWIE